ncbi:hypothetical protein BB561_005205 [Smittium simulii]|uniref:Uncharacterized protein n=1 Tax=Smittium simulii TaxID=133385 RepID=A0A2T9YBI0_9FUNG|nr:hypothetical protein BB561_005205 [Smittium simulii]
MNCITISNPFLRLGLNSTNSTKFFINANIRFCKLASLNSTNSHGIHVKLPIKKTNCFSHINSKRHFTFSKITNENLKESNLKLENSNHQKQKEGVPQVIYTGPLAKVSKLLKYTSIASIAGVIVSSPLFFLVNSPLPTIARFGLLTITGTMMISSLFIVNWAFSSYINSIRLLNDSAPEDIDKNSLLLIEKIDFWGRKMVVVVRLNTLSPIENVPMRTWIASANTVLSDEEENLILSSLKSGKISRKFVAGRFNDQYYAHVDTFTTPLLNKIKHVL